MFLVGITGGIATGKSLVCSIFQNHNIPVIDADDIAKIIVESGKPAFWEIVGTFGADILKENGDIDRERLGEVIFNDADKRQMLNKITHPHIYKEMKKQVMKLFFKGEQFVVLDLPLLFETKSAISYLGLYKTIVVACDSEIQMSRLMLRNKYSNSEAQKRIHAQMPIENKIEMADIVIENSGSCDDTKKQTEDIIKLLKASKHHIQNRAIIGGSLFGVLIFSLIIMYSTINLICKIL